MSRRVKKWAVKYTSEVECEYGYTHKVGNVLVGLDSEDEAKTEAKRLKGKVTTEWYTPPLTDSEIKQLNDDGVPVERNSYGLGFKGVPIVFSDSPSTLESIKSFYEHAKPQADGGGK